VTPVGEAARISAAASRKDAGRKKLSRAGSFDIELDFELDRAGENALGLRAVASTPGEFDADDAQEAASAGPAAYTEYWATRYVYGRFANVALNRRGPSFLAPAR
jgi:hypothetical protein